MRNDQALVDAVKRQLIDFVEPNTRFDRSSLPVIDSETGSCRVTGQQMYTVVLGVDHRSGRGKLQATALKLGGAPVLRAHVERKAEANRQALPGRLHRWAAGQTEFPGIALTSADCFNGAETAGYEHSCGACQAQGQVSCTSCWGVGTSSCFMCHGSGKTTCASCHGKGEKSCQRCSGSGTVGEHRERRITNHASNTSHVESYLEQVTCPACGGRRKERCTACSGGSVPCSHCRATGQVECPTCSGKGKVTCKDCDGTGALHDLALQTCSVTQSFSLQADVAGDEPRSTIEALPSLERLCALTRVEQRGVDVGSTSVTRRVEARMELTSVTVRAADEQFEIGGYGINARVFDFKNIVGALLQNDLVELEHALAKSPWLPLGPVPALDSALGKFLKSEVNARIGQVAGGNGEALERLANHDLRGAVSVDYVKRAAAAVRKAATRIYRSEIFRPALLVGIAPTIALVVIPLLNRTWRSESGWVALCIALLGGVGAELWALFRLKSRFDAELAPKAVKMVRATWTLWWWRFAMFLEVMVGVVAAAIVAFNWFGWTGR